MDRFKYLYLLLSAVLLFGIIGCGSHALLSQDTFRGSSGEEVSIPAIEGAQSYHWSQLSGVAVQIADPDARTLSFIAPTVERNETLRFDLEASFGDLVRHAEVTVIISPLPITDTTAPVITLHGEQNITLTVGESYVELGATAMDDVDGNITDCIETVSTVDTTTVGDHTVTYTVSDTAGNQATAMRYIHVVLPLDTTAPVITLQGEQNITLEHGATYTELGASAMDDVDGNVSVTISGSVDSSTIGEYTLTYSATDIAGNTASIQRSVHVIAKLLSLRIDPEHIALRLGEEASVHTEGLYSDGSSREMLGVAYHISDVMVARIDADGAITPTATGTASLYATLDTLRSPQIDVTIGVELNTSDYDFIHFGTEYTDQIPIDATKSHYDPQRFCMIAGQIFDVEGRPLSGVRVSLHAHAEYGSTLTDDNGSYVIPAEGGLQLTMHYTKEGYTTIDRHIQAPVQDWVRSPDVTMLQEDTKVTTIDLNSSTPKIHVSTPVSDDRGVRSTTLVFAGVSHATVTAPDGSSRELSSLRVRATEFKTPDSMPSDLPRESAYTYCADLTVDGVEDEERVTFDAPVIMYVENFLGFDVGEIVPVGYYDRAEGRWKGSDNGVVVQLLDTDGDGRIDALDSNGSGTPNDLDGDGDFSDEVTGLQDDPTYTAGATYWRAAITHFTPWDLNWPWGPPPDATAPDAPDVDADDPKPNDCRADVSSYVTKKSRVFHEDIPIAGTDITLHYSSKRVDGYTYLIDATIDTTDAPSSVVATMATLEIAGRRFERPLSAGEKQQIQFIWDGKDAAGKELSGIVKGKLTIGYRYRLFYYSALSDLDRAWAGIGGSSTGIFTRSVMELIISQPLSIIVESNDISSSIASGWGLSAVDRATSAMVIRGDGTIDEHINMLEGIIDTVAGTADPATERSLFSPRGIAVDLNGDLYIADSINQRILKVDTEGEYSTIAGDNAHSAYGGDGGLATEAQLAYPSGVEVDIKGNIYIADTNNHRIRKIDTNGIITTIAGNGTSGYGGDGGLATEAQLAYPGDVTVDVRGDIYIADTNNNVIRKIDSNGIITTVAGNGIYGYSGEGILATDAKLAYPYGVELDTKGNIYIADTGNNRIRKVNSNNIITTIAGHGGIIDQNSDGDVAIEAYLYYPHEIAVDSSGNLYIADTNNNTIRKVDTSGIITIVVGNGTLGYSGDGRLSKQAKLAYPEGVTISSTGDLYIADTRNNRIRKVTLLPLFYKNGLEISSYLYHKNDTHIELFDSIGRQKLSIYAPTGALLHSFGYDDQGRLISITDRFGQAMTIERDGEGRPTRITAPDGQVTSLEVDAQGDLVEVRYEDGSTYTFSYYAGSLMDTMHDPSGNKIVHYYDAFGRIIEEVDGIEGSYRFSKDITTTGTQYRMTLPEGEVSASQDITLPNGDINSTITLATGESYTATFANDESRTEVHRDGTSTLYRYDLDPLTYQRTLVSTQTTLPSGLSKTTTYASSYDGNETHTNSKTQTTTQNAKTTTLHTDYNTGITTLTTPESRVATSSYAIDTLLTTQTQIGSLTPTTYSYDDRGRLTSQTTGDRSVTYTYDSRGNIATITDPRGQTTRYGHDIMDRLTAVTYPNGTTEQFSYDANGNLLTRTIPTPADHHFTYNGVDLRTSTTSPEDKATTYTYDKSRHLTGITKPSGKSITHHYENGRSESTTTPEGTTNYSYLFADKVGTISQGDEGFSFEYDGTLVTSTTQSGILNHTMNFTYNNDFQVTSSTYAGATESYSYDNDGLLISSGAYTMTRDAQNGYTTQVTDGTLTQNRSYNSYGEITEVSDESFTYQLTTRDHAGAITQKKETLNGTTETYDYTYDTMGRLTEVKQNGSTVEAYTYDNNGNRASATVNGITTTASYTLDDSLIVYGDNSYRYDDDGYLEEKVTPDGTTTYEYGTMGQLLAVSTPEHNITYAHNALNQRVAKLVDGVVAEKYLWANLTTLLAIYDGSDNLIQRFEYADQRMPVSMTMDGEKYYLHYDQVGSLGAISDTSHHIIKEITYDTYGNILTDSNTSFKVPFGFAGGLYDADTGLTRFGYRDYDATTGKWTAKDPIGFRGGDSNLYGYVLGDPVNLVDPSGLVDLNLFPRNDLLYIPAYWAGWTSPNYTVGGHGAPGIMGDINNKDLSPFKLANLIKNDPNYNGEDIDLYVCNAGTGGNDSFAQDLSNIMGVTVTAPNGFYLYSFPIGANGPIDGASMLPFYPIKSPK